MILFEIGFLKITLIDLIDIVLVSWLFYKVYAYFRGTRAGQMLVGLIILMVGSFIFNGFGFSPFSFNWDVASIIEVIVLGVPALNIC